MQFKFDMSKPYFDEIKDVSGKVKSLLKKNRSNAFVQEMKNSIQSNAEVVSGFPIFFRKVLEPISYERFFSEKPKTNSSSGVYNYNNNIVAVGKWFGYKGWKNISHIDNGNLIEKLTQKHIDLIPDKEKRNLAQDFFDYSRVFTGENNENIIEVPMNVSTTLYNFNWVQIRDMSKKYKGSNGNRYYRSNLEDKDHINYIYPRESIPNSTITSGTVEYNAKNNNIQLHFFYGEKEVENITLSASTVEEYSNGSRRNPDEDSEYLFLSERLFNWGDYSSTLSNKFHEMFADDIETLLTPEIKTAVKSFIKKQQTIKDDWTTLQIKYARKLLQKGNI